MTTLHTLLTTIPDFSVTEAQAWTRRLYGIVAHAEPFPSERDQNFLLTTADGERYVLKIANAGESRDVLLGQNKVLDYVADHMPALSYPKVYPTLDGQTIDEVRDTRGIRYPVRLLSYVAGMPLARRRPFSPSLLHNLGSVFGRLDRTLAGLSHVALIRTLEWDLRHAGSVISQYSTYVPYEDRRALIDSVRARWQKVVEPVLPSLRTSIVHNDGNDDNVLVSGSTWDDDTITGVIDFGDVVQTCTVFEVAICSAYALFDRSDPLYAAACVVAGYHEVYPLTEQELELLIDLIAMRLCVSIAIAAWRRALDPANASVTVSEEPAWAALDRLARLNPRLAHYTFRDAAGLPACPTTVPVVAWLEDHAEHRAPVIRPDPSMAKTTVFDLRPGNPEWADLPDTGDTAAWTRALFERIRADRAVVGIGRYAEARRCYTSSAYRSPTMTVEDWRTIHLGMDLFQVPGTPVYAPFDGMVWSAMIHDRPHDYGPTIILRHEPETGIVFYTLYGHLSTESVDHWRPGMPIKKGERIGTIGSAVVNGGWPPHVHVQLIVDLLDHQGNFPGVCPSRDRSVWLQLSPDPNLILRIPDIPPAQDGCPPQELVESRVRVIGKSVRVAYSSPLKLVQGWKQYVYDHLGREYLDAANNVCHVGHGHPAVVDAVRTQMRLVNTNTRFLHDSLVAYAEKLCATLPEPLRICYFVCSGSEANELAIRMARAHTGGTDVLVIDGGYHGNTTTLVDLSPYKFNGPGGTGKPPFVLVAPLPDCYRGPYRDVETAGQSYAQQAIDLLAERERQGRRLMACLGEPLLSCGGQLVLPPGYLRKVYEAVRRAGGVCIADEVQTGFGRVGTHFWGFQTQDVVPDIVTLGKPMGNGYPMGAVVTTPAIAESFANGMEYFNSFGGTPVSCAVGMAVLDIIEQEGLQAHALTVGSALKKRLQAIQTRFPMIGEVRGQGLFLGIELVRHPETREPAGAETAYVVERLKEYGILLSADGLSRNVLKIKPPMIFSQLDADRLVCVLERILSEPRLQRFPASV